MSLKLLGLFKKEYNRIYFGKKFKKRINMNIIEKELEGRRSEIKKSVELLFKGHMKITDWDIPEADDEKAAKLLIVMIKEEVAKIEQDIIDGKYNNY